MAVDASGHEYNEDDLGTQEQDIVQECPVSALPRARFGHGHPLGLRLQFDVSASTTLNFKVSGEYLNDICGRGAKRIRLALGQAKLRTADPNPDVG